jgi:hypothetical protein
LQYNPQEVALTVNKAKKNESGRVQAGKDETISTEPAVIESDAAEAKENVAAEDTETDPILTT